MEDQSFAELVAINREIAEMQARREQLLQAQRPKAIREVVSLVRNFQIGLDEIAKALESPQPDDEQLVGYAQPAPAAVEAPAQQAELQDQRETSPSARKKAQKVPKATKAAKAANSAKGAENDATPAPAKVAAKKAAKRAAKAPAKQARATKAPAKRPAAAKKAAPPPLYRNPETGETWTGRGRAPLWMTRALAMGASHDDFLIDKVPAQGAPSEAQSAPATDQQPSAEARPAEATTVAADVAEASASSEAANAEPAVSAHAEFSPTSAFPLKR